MKEFTRINVIVDYGKYTKNIKKYMINIFIGCAMKENRLLVIIEDIPVSIWQGFKELCEVYNLPYHTLKAKPFPRKWNEFEILKLPFRQK